ncbi:MAG: hypothetical protein PHD83_01870 [Caldisericia bacterium]|nr:hypothetical protein [Caldisericia bacterium]
MESKYGFIMCVCTGKCPGFSKMDMWDFVNRIRVELPVEYAFIHPQLCEEDGDRFLHDFLQAKRKVIIGACAPSMQKKLFRDAFSKAGLSVDTDLIALDVRDMTTNEAFDKVAHVVESIDKGEK